MQTITGHLIIDATMKQTLFLDLTDELFWL